MSKTYNVKERASKIGKARIKTHPVIFYGMVLCTIFFGATLLSPEGMERRNPSESYYWDEAGYIQIGQPPAQEQEKQIETEEQEQEPETEPETEPEIENETEENNQNALNDIVDVDAEEENGEPARKDSSILYSDLEPEQPQPEPQVETEESSYVPGRTFTAKNGASWTGQQIIDEVLHNDDARPFYEAFKAQHGKQVADEMAVVLKFENGSYRPTTTGVCSFRFQIGGDHRNCNYADINSNGFDAGMLQVNTHYQSSRIAKLGGPSCIPQNNKDITDPCTKSKVDWLHNTDNNLAMALDIYAEQGWQPWVGAKRAGIVPW